MIESITGILASLRQSTPAILMGVTIATGILLFAGEGALETFGLEEIRRTYRPYIGGCFVASVSVLSSHFLITIFSSAKTCWLRSGKKKRSQKRFEAKEKEREGYLRNLTPEEKGYLEPYVLGDINTQKFSIEDGIAGGLEAKRIIYKSAKVGDMLSGWSYNIQPWAKEYLSTNVELLDGAVTPRRVNRM